MLRLQTRQQTKKFKRCVASLSPDTTIGNYRITNKEEIKDFRFLSLEKKILKKKLKKKIFFSA